MAGKKPIQKPKGPSSHTLSQKKGRFLLSPFEKNLRPGKGAFRVVSSVARFVGNRDLFGFHLAFDLDLDRGIARNGFERRKGIRYPEKEPLEGPRQPADF